MKKLLDCIKKVLDNEVQLINNFVNQMIHGSSFSNPALTVVCNDALEARNTTTSSLVNDPIMWYTVPRSKTSVAKRNCRRMGYTDGKGVCKLLPVKKLLTCPKCGDPHEVKRLCPTCYKKNNNITKLMQRAMVREGFHKPMNKEYEAVFKNETFGEYKNTRPVYFDQDRPKFFAPKMTLRSNVKLSSETTPANPNPLVIK